MSTTTATQFEPILLNVDNYYINNRLNQIKLDVPFFQNILDIATSFVGRKLTAKEETAVMKGRKPAVIDIVRPDFQFPNATDEFNLESLGKNPEVMGPTYSHKMWDEKHLTVKSGKVVFKDDVNEILTETASTYTDHPKQNEVYNEIKAFCDMMNGFLEKNMIDPNSGFNLKPFKFMDYTVESGYRPKPFYIKNLDENGTYRGY